MITNVTRLLNENAELREEFKRILQSVDSTMGALTATLHKELLDTGLVTVAQWNSEIAPKLSAVIVAANRQRRHLIQDEK